MAIRSRHFAKRITMGDTSTDRGPSRNIWDNCPWLELQNNPQHGLHFMDDFTGEGIVFAHNLAAAAVSALGTTGPWTGASGNNAGNIATTLATNKHGIVELRLVAENLDTIIAYPKSAVTAGCFDFSVGNRIWMETRLSVSSIANSRISLFAGFAEENLCVTTALMSNLGALPDKDLVGFTILEADGDSINTVARKAGQTTLTVKTEAVVPVAATYVKLGLYCDGSRIYFYKDGVLLPDSLALSTTNFPLGEEMAFYIGGMSGASISTDKVSVDWVRLAQQNGS